MTESNEQFANRMRVKRGDKPLPDYPFSLTALHTAVEKLFEGIDATMVTVGNLEARVRQLPDVDGCILEARDATTLTFDIKLQEPLHSDIVGVGMHRVRVAHRGGHT